MIARHMPRWIATAAAGVAALGSVCMTGYVAAMALGFARVPWWVVRFEWAWWVGIVAALAWLVLWAAKRSEQ